MILCSVYTGHRLLEAAQAGNTVLLEELASQGHSVNECNYDLMTPLHEASLAGHADCVRLLLNLGASVKSQLLYLSCYILVVSQYIIYSVLVFVNLLKVCQPFSFTGCTFRYSLFKLCGSTHNVSSCCCAHRVLLYDATSCNFSMTKLAPLYF